LYNLIFATCNITLTNTLHQAKTKCFSWLYVCNVLLLLCCSCRLKLYNITFTYFPFWSLRSVYLLYSGYIQVTSLSYSTQQSTTIIIIIIIIITTTITSYSTINHYCYSIIDVIITAYFGVLVYYLYLYFWRRKNQIKLALSFWTCCVCVSVCYEENLVSLYGEFLLFFIASFFY
jgi:hypothetical protein